MLATEDMIGELHDSSIALLTALRERSPGFLEHLERRERVLLALGSNPAMVGDIPMLQAALLFGDAASLEARQMRQESIHALTRLQSQRNFSRGLASGAGQSTPALDVKA